MAQSTQSYFRYLTPQLKSVMNFLLEYIFKKKYTGWELRLMFGNPLARPVPFVTVYEAIVAKYQSEVITTPATSAEQRAISNLLSQTKNYHNPVSALDGKHLAIRQPAGGGSMFYNNQRYHLMCYLLRFLDMEHQ